MQSLLLARLEQTILQMHMGIGEEEKEESKTFPTLSSFLLNFFFMLLLEHASAMDAAKMQKATLIFAIFMIQ